MAIDISFLELLRLHKELDEMLLRLRRHAANFKG